MGRHLRVAAAQYPIEEVLSFAEVEAKLDRWVSEAAKQGAHLVVFPEYAAMEVTRLAGRDIAGDLQGSLVALQYYLAELETAHLAAARQYGVYILGGSAPVHLADGRFVNRSKLYAPSGRIAMQTKQIMTRFEAEKWGISGSAGLCVFDIGIVKLGIAICYDSEFPMLVRALAEAGAEIVLVPSCTDTLAGFHRVRTACAARALENQIFTVMAATVGNAVWSSAVDVNVGAAGFFAPPDSRFTPSGVIAEGELNVPGWIYADLDLDLLAAVREGGDVLNARNWDKQAASLRNTPKLIPFA